jgi:hypothetical protein
LPCFFFCCCVLGGLAELLPGAPVVAHLQLHREGARIAQRVRSSSSFDARSRRTSPATLVVLRELEIIALAMHAGADDANAAPGVEPRAERWKRMDIPTESRRF